MLNWRTLALMLYDFFRNVGSGIIYLILKVSAITGEDKDFLLNLAQSESGLLTSGSSLDANVFYMTVFDQKKQFPDVTREGELCYPVLYQNREERQALIFIHTIPQVTFHIKNSCWQCYRWHFKVFPK